MFQIVQAPLDQDMEDDDKIVSDGQVVCVGLLLIHTIGAQL